MYHQAVKKIWPIFFWFYPPKKHFFSGGAQISRNGAVQPNFWKSHSANMKPDCRKYLQAIIVAVDKETNLTVFSSTSGEKVWWKHHLCHSKTVFSQLSEVQSENDSGWLCFRAMSLKRTCWQRRRTWWRARRSWTRRVEKCALYCGESSVCFWQKDQGWLPPDWTLWTLTFFTRPSSSSSSYFRSYSFALYSRVSTSI
jgi:hypothetical protein